MRALTIKKIIPVIQKYLYRDINKKQLVRYLKKIEGPTSWFFVLDEDRLLFRNRCSKVVINLKQSQTKTEIEKQIKKLYTQNPDEEIINYKKIERAKKKIINRFGNKKVVAFSGTARQKFDTKKTKKIITDILSFLSQDTHIILTGGYHLGIPMLVSKLAKKKNFETIAVSPKVIKTCNRYKKQIRSLYDISLLEGEDWGEESYLFSGIADVIFFMAGGNWTEIEYSYAKRYHKKIFLVKGIGGISDAIKDSSPNISHINPLQLLRFRDTIQHNLIVI